MIENILYSLILLSTFSAKVLSVSLGIAELSPFRLLFIFLLIFSILAFRDSLFLFLRNNIQYNFTALLAVYSLITIFWANDYLIWLRQEYYVLMGAMLVIIIPHILDNNKKIRKALLLFQISILIQALIGGYEIYTGNYLFDNAETSYFDKRGYFASRTFFLPCAMMYNPNNLATVLILGIALTVGNFFYLNTKLKKALSIISFFLLFIVLIYTQSRANYLGAIMATLLYIIKYNKFTNKAFVIILSLFGLWFVFDVFESSMYFDINTGSDQIRVNLILNGIRYIIDTFGFGIGTGQAVWWLSNYNYHNTYGIFLLHNMWLDLYVSFGILIGTCFVCTYFKILKLLYKISLSNRNDKYIATGLLLFYIAFIVGCISSSNVLYGVWFWMIWAITVTFLRNANHNSNVISLKQMTSRKYPDLLHNK